MIFIIQYLTVYQLSFAYPTLPMHPPLGISWSMFYLFGGNAWCGLFLGEICGYSLSGVSPDITILYSCIDLICGYIGAKICLTVFTTDIRPLADRLAAGTFFNTIAFVICPISASLKFAVINFHYFFANTSPLLPTKLTAYDCLQLWLADLNATLVIASLLLSWVYVPFSREKIFCYPNVHDSEQELKPDILNCSFWPRMLAFWSRLPRVALFAFTALFIAAAIIFISKVQAIFLIAAAAPMVLYFAYKHGYLIATALLFILASVFTAYFSIWHQLYWQQSNSIAYTVIPLTLLVFSILILFAGHFRIKKLL